MHLFLWCLFMVKNYQKIRFLFNVNVYAFIPIVLFLWLKIAKNCQKWVCMGMGKIFYLKLKKIVRKSSKIHCLLKLGTVTKIDKRNKTASKKFEDDVISANYEVIAILLIYGHLGAIRKSDSGCTVCKSYIFINNNLLSYNN